MTNVFEVCQWLVLKRPDVLAIANQMHNSANISLDSSTAAIIPQPAVTSNNNNDKVVTCEITITYFLCKYGLLIFIILLII
jgi:hypothetical protein